MKLDKSSKCKMGACLALFLSGILVSSASHAVEIYRWVDERGRTQFSDAPPPDSKKAVTRTDSRRYEISTEQHNEAKARAASEKARSAANAERNERQAPVPALTTPPPGNAAAKPVPEPTDCASLLQRFKDHSECLAPFMNINGSFKPNAFETCGHPVPYPAKECS